MELLHSYNNGNSKVSIYSNGTKIREYEGEFKPVHPESFDCKITNYCDGQICTYCHEQSGTNGKHADLNKLTEVIKDLPAGVEGAFGGGSVLSHPDLIPFLKTVKQQGLIANTTINQRHIKQGKDQIEYMISNDLIKGIGISYTDSKYLPDIESILKLTDNLVFHVIMGINNVDVIEELNSFCKSNNKQCKILILGYKNYGNGSKHYSLNKNLVEENKLQWFRYLPKYFKKDNLTLSFDNLAIEQLKLKRFFTDKGWEKFYLGKEGKASMYIDAVKQEYAICSVDPNRVSFNDMNLISFFQNIKTLDY